MGVLRTVLLCARYGFVLCVIITETYTWIYLNVTGEIPRPRHLHSSGMFLKGCVVFVLRCKCTICAKRRAARACACIALSACLIAFESTLILSIVIVENGMYIVGGYGNNDNTRVCPLRKFRSRD